MKAKFNRASLQEALALVTSIIPSRTPKPILQCLRMTAKDDAVTLSATDLEVGIQYSVAQVEVATAGESVLPADKISAIVREGIDEVVEIEATEASVQVRGADSHFTIYGHDPEQFPRVPGFDGKADFEVKLDKLQEGIEQTVFSAAKESTRYALNGILWEVQGKKLTMVATDGRRLARSIVSLETAIKGDLPTGRIIVPAKTMTLLDRIPAVSEGATVSVRFAENQIILACGPAVISSNLVEGNFPKYDDIIPKDHDKKAVISTGGMLSAVRRAALMVNEETRGVRFSLTNGSLTISSRAPEAGDAQVEMAIDYNGPAIEIGFNPGFVVDAMKVIEPETFELHLGEPDRPGMIKSGSHFLYIVMPVNP
jgi:DNA polymerase III subunit beta